MPRSGRPQQHSCILHASLWQEVQGKLPVLAFSALPFLSVQALADSGLGKRLRVGPLLQRAAALPTIGLTLRACAGQHRRQQSHI